MRRPAVRPPVPRWLPWRLAQIVALGATLATYAVWQLLTTLSILFHHVNVRLPRDLERTLASLLVTLRLHGIHHAQNEALANANWSSGLTQWDRLHRSYVEDIEQTAIAVGLPVYDTEADASISARLVAPFRPQIDVWRVR